ncbi:sugar phosphate nucleotidyltransferase [Pendulispora albinea]|uniref:glucose-1-phosphate thymidylyltransferase n=1 Tax=Pendulispora albinea TaxID=2741071 RepID=A0ABZ2LUK7_9BACT
MWGIVPAAGMGTRIQPLAFSKELLPVGSRLDGTIERPCTVSEYLIRRMVRAGADKICMVISANKSDIVAYYGGEVPGASLAYVVQPEPAGLCDAIFRALPLLGRDEDVVVGLPDTIWFPEDALTSVRVGDREIGFVLFPVERPELFDAVSLNEAGEVREIQVKQQGARSNWIWGAFRLKGSTLHELYELWCERDKADPYLGTLVNAYLERGGRAYGARIGKAYVDVGTLHGYREALELLGGVHGSLNGAGSDPDRSARAGSR